MAIPLSRAAIHLLGSELFDSLPRCTRRVTGEKPGWHGLDSAILARNSLLRSSMPAPRQRGNKSAEYVLGLLYCYPVKLPERVVGIYCCLAFRRHRDPSCGETRKLRLSFSIHPIPSRHRNLHVLLQYRVVEQFRPVLLLVTMNRNHGKPLQTYGDRQCARCQSTRPQTAAERCQKGFLRDMKSPCSSPRYRKLHRCKRSRRKSRFAVLQSKCLLHTSHRECCFRQWLDKTQNTTHPSARQAQPANSDEPRGSNPEQTGGGRTSCQCFRVYSAVVERSRTGANRTMRPPVRSE